MQMGEHPRCPKCDAEIMLGNRCANCLFNDSPQVFVCGGKPTPEAQRELDDYRVWLMLPKPRQEFHAWRKVRAPDSEVRDG